MVTLSLNISLAPSMAQVFTTPTKPSPQDQTKSLDPSSKKQREIAAKSPRPNPRVVRDTQFLFGNTQAITLYSTTQIYESEKELISISRKECSANQLNGEICFIIFLAPGLSFPWSRWRGHLGQEYNFLNDEFKKGRFRGVYFQRPNATGEYADTCDVPNKTLGQNSKCVNASNHPLVKKALSSLRGD